MNYHLNRCLSCGGSAVASICTSASLGRRHRIACGKCERLISLANPAAAAAAWNKQASLLPTSMPEQSAYIKQGGRGTRRALTVTEVAMAMLATVRRAGAEGIAKYQLIRLHRQACYQDAIHLLVDSGEVAACASGFGNRGTRIFIAKEHDHA